MNNTLLSLIAAMLLALVPASAISATADGHKEEDSAESASGIGFSPKDIIFDHLGDGYGWEVPFDHHHRIPLPVIVYASDGWHIFSSARITSGHVYRDGDIDFFIAGADSDHKGKVVEQLPDGSIKRPIDISITKNVCALFITIILVMWAIFSLAAWHRKHPDNAPRRLRGFIELAVDFIYTGVIKSTLKQHTNKFAPYLLTLFFFILVMNLMGLIVIFPGGANLTGNIAVTLVMSVITFLVTNVYATKHYWKEILWPDVPLWLKFPIPIMQVIEIFGIFTKPAALTVRLFANMLGGHMIVIVLTILIFIFSYMGPVVTGVATVFSQLFTIFMLLIDVLVSFIQAYVFTMLSTIFISFGQEDGHEENHKHKAEDSGSAIQPASATA